MKIKNKYTIDFISDSFGVNTGNLHLEFIPGFRPRNELIIKCDNDDTGKITFYYIELEEYEWNAFKDINGKQTMLDHIIAVIDYEENNADTDQEFSTVDFIDNTFIRKITLIKDGEEEVIKGDEENG